MNIRTIATAVAGTALTLAAASSFADPISVTSGLTAAQLAAALGGNGITISNATYTGAAAANGTFTGGAAAGLSIGSGVILSSGSAAAAGQKWNTDNGVPDFSNGQPGSPLITGSNDSATLSFHLSTTSTTISFNYFFASAEYTDFVYAFNDEFAFFISGPGITGSQNIALVPGTNSPVSINTVNGGGPNSAQNTNPLGPQNQQFFLDNLTGTLLPDFNYDGLTTLFTATASGLTAGADYTLTLVIADASDQALDTSVFIQANSITAAPPGPPSTTVPEPEELAIFGLGLLGLGLARRRVLR